MYRLHDEITADYNDMIYAETSQKIEVRRKAFIRKWRIKHRAVADSLEEAGARLLTFTPLGAWQCRSSAPTPYRAHQPHPTFYRLVGYGAVEVVGPPQNPVGSKAVRAAICTSPGCRFATPGPLAEMPDDSPADHRAFHSRR